MSNLTDFYKVLNTLELDYKTHSIIADAACQLSIKEMRKGNKIATDIFNK